LHIFLDTIFTVVPRIMIL